MDGVGSRKVDRRHVLLNATIISSDGSKAARVRDLSRSGVRVLCDLPLAVDCDVIFKRGVVFVAARIAWADETSAGLEFYRHLNPMELANGSLS
jgi:hypothetical protein